VRSITATALVTVTKPPATSARLHAAVITWQRLPLLLSAWEVGNPAEVFVRFVDALSLINDAGQLWA
jgi:hypothetical protein